MSPNFASIKSKDLKLFASNRSNHNKIGVGSALQAPGSLRPSALGQAAATRWKTPRALKGNMFLQELKVIRSPESKVSEKYHILYNVLAPKLVQKTALVESKAQSDALEVLQYLVAGDPAAGEQASEMMPLLDSSLPLKQDIIYILARFVPGGIGGQRRKPGPHGLGDARVQQARPLPLGAYAAQAPQQQLP